MAAAAFLRNLIAAVSYRLHIVLTPPLTVCRQTVAGQRNRTIKEATVKRVHYDDHEQFGNHLANFISAYNFGRRLQTLKGLTPYESVCKQWTIEPERFILNSIHQMPGLYT